MIGLTELQTAIFNQLENAGLDVYNGTPPNNKYPHVYLGEEYITPFETKTKRSYEVYHVIHTYAKGKDRAIINGYNEKVIGALFNPLPLANGYYISRTTLDFAQNVQEDKDLWHGVIRFTFHISKG